MSRRLLTLGTLALLLALMAAPAGAQTRGGKTPPQSAPKPAAPAVTAEAAQRFVGVWTSEFMDTTFLRLELKFADGKLSGTIVTGDMHTAEDGRLTEVTEVTRSPDTLFDIVVDGDTITFSRRDEGDVDRMQVTRAGPGSAELRFVAAGSTPPPRIQTLLLTRRIDR